MDNGTQFKNRLVKEVLEEAGVLSIWAGPYTHHANGVAERAVRSAKDPIVKNASSDRDTPKKLLLLHRHLIRTNLGNLKHTLTSLLSLLFPQELRAGSRGKKFSLTRKI